MEHLKFDRAILINGNFSFKILGAEGANVVRLRHLNVIERPENLFVNFEILRHGHWQPQFTMSFDDFERTFIGNEPVYTFTEGYSICINLCIMENGKLIKLSDNTRVFPHVKDFRVEFDCLIGREESVTA